ncbi:hypothetical protein FAA97_10780 [Peteryoungia ipomoeae]|uniref:Inhibitor of vertebrate lysozyme (Ivy) n=1 Tax=Peteryoungia ipomoeae TaxID=1210932 RepID=A0A4S8P063_9HYPH|nr:hypothetical protein FAA97_10780 [Peteryoungia ipomoeae]
MHKALLIASVLAWLITPAFAQTSPPALSGNYLPQVLASSEAHRESLERLIAGKPGLPYWIRSLTRQSRYVALASEEVTVRAKPMQLFRACEAGRCEASWLRILYSADGKRGLLYIFDDKLGIKIFGDPLPEELSFLTRG